MSSAAEHQTQTAARRRRSSAAVVLEFLGSMNLAIALLVTIAIASVIGTVLLQNQPYNEYYDRFGEFWFKTFELLGLYDVYSSGWFLAILAFLVASTSVCIYRHAPIMIRDMGHFRLNVQLKSLRAFHHRQEWHVGQPLETVAQTGAAFLRARGFRVRNKHHQDHMVVAGMRGAFNRAGYLLTHSAIVLICIGGLIDGNIGLKLKELTGRIEILHEDMRVPEIPEQSRLAPGDSVSFRGNRTIPEGATATGVTLNLRDGYVFQELPFAIEVKAFRVEYYTTGQPKSFESDLVIHDEDYLDQPLEKTIAVNHPLIYRGYAIYQSSFGDGGSRLTLKAWPLGTRGPPSELEGEVFTELDLGTPRGPRTVEFTDFRLFNINPVEDPESEKKFRNWGPSFTYKLRNPAGEAKEYKNYMQPVERDGRLFYMSGVRSSPSEGFGYLRIPADPDDAGLDRFMRLHHLLHDEERLRAIVTEYARQRFASQQGEGGPASRLVSSVNQMVSQFVDGDLDRVLERMAADLPPERFERMRDVYLDILINALVAVYEHVLREEGVDVSGGVTDRADRQFFDDAFEALSSLPRYDSPFYLQLSSFEHVEATGLQVTRSPGKSLVYLGCVMLIGGIFVMFYLPQRRAWLHLSPAPGGTRVVFAATSTRRQLDFDNEYESLRHGLDRALGTTDSGA